VWSWAATSESVFGRLMRVSRGIHLDREKAYYFSTHGCRRLGSCFDVAALEELADAAAACRARMSKKFDIVVGCS
jgi:hypothetical protein